MKLYIYCAGGFGKEVMDVARRLNSAEKRWTELHFVDDDPSKNEVYGQPVFRFSDVDGSEVIIASGEPAIREKIRDKVATTSNRLPIIIDSSTIVAPTAKIRNGVVITPLCSISSNAVIGENASVNTMSIVGHDVQIGDNSVISSMVNIGGGCKIGRNTYVGMGALIKEGLSIGDDVIIGMGSVVYNDIPDGVIALGNPARPMRPNDKKRVFK